MRYKQIWTQWALHWRYSSKYWFRLCYGSSPGSSSLFLKHVSIYLFCEICSEIVDGLKHFPRLQQCRETINTGLCLETHCPHCPGMNRQFITNNWIISDWSHYFITNSKPIKNNTHSGWLQFLVPLFRQTCNLVCFTEQNE